MWKPQLRAHVAEVSRWHPEAPLPVGVTVGGAPFQPRQLRGAQDPPSRGKLTKAWVCACAQRSWREEGGRGPELVSATAPGCGALPRSRALCPLRTAGMGGPRRGGFGDRARGSPHGPQIQSPQLRPPPKTSLTLQPILRTELLTFP